MSGSISPTKVAASASDSSPRKSRSPVKNGKASRILGDLSPEAKERLEAEKRSWMDSIHHVLTRFIKFTGIDKLLAILGIHQLLALQHDQNGEVETKNEEHPNKRKHTHLEQEEEGEELSKVEKEAKKWRPDSAYVSIQHFIRKMFGAPDPNGNLDRDQSSDDQNPDSDQITETGHHWNLKPDCNFLEDQNKEAIPFTSPVKDKEGCDENLNAVEAESANQVS